MKTFMVRLLVVLALLPTAFASTASAAAPARTTANVNLRAGPGTAYPTVVTLPAGAALRIYGCLTDRSWCDIGWGRERGWMAASYIQVMYRGQYVILRPAVVPAVGIGVVAFNEAYWHRYYVGRPWYRPYVYHPRPHVWVVR